MKQTVEEAAKEYYLSIFAKYNNALIITKKSFKAGAEWQAKKSGWISVEERLPEYNKRVFVLHSNGLIDSSVYHCDNNWDSFDNDIIAWMPIPSFDEILEAYKDVLQRMKEKGD